MKSIRKILRTIWIIFGISFTVVLIISFQAKGVDKALLQTSDSVKVVNDAHKLEFTPLKSAKDSALIFYPGGLVDPKAYVPMARKIAGGNHSQFGYYSFQIGDKKATISRDAQQAILVDSLIQELQRVIPK